MLKVRLIAAATVAALCASCATEAPPQMEWTGEGQPTQALLDRDHDACTYDTSRSSVGSPQRLAAGMPTDGMAVLGGSIIERNRLQGMYASCMRSRGWRER